MTKLSPLAIARAKVELAEKAFMESLVPDYKDQLAFYTRHFPAGYKAKPSAGKAVEAHKAWMTVLHAFYALRDGPNGFLGGRGL